MLCKQAWRSDTWYRQTATCPGGRIQRGGGERKPKVSERADLGSSRQSKARSTEDRGIRTWGDPDNPRRDCAGKSGPGTPNLKSSEAGEMSQ